MIKTQNNKSNKTQDKIKYIKVLCNNLGVDFDNTISNKYALIYKEVKHTFTTYNDTINALHLAQMLRNEIK